ncbi:MAG: hypothetical protein ABMA15_14555 [Vicinamibacterales bacterium]
MRPDFLVATPSWLSGAARVLDLGGQFDQYNDSHSIEAADAKALFCDWRMVGETFRDAINVFRRESETPKAK